MAAVVVTAVVGAMGTNVTSSWYRKLSKPAWQPPDAVFGPVWTTLYALIAVASSRVSNRISDEDRRRSFAAALGTNLVLNAAWTWVFFTARRPRWALAEIVLLGASTLDLTRRAAAVDRAAGRLLMPYAAWVGFATALTGDIARRNPPGVSG